MKSDNLLNDKQAIVAACFATSVVTFLVTVGVMGGPSTELIQTQKSVAEYQGIAAKFRSENMTLRSTTHNQTKQIAVMEAQLKVYEVAAEKERVAAERRALIQEIADLVKEQME